PSGRDAARRSLTCQASRASAGRRAGPQDRPCYHQRHMYSAILLAHSWLRWVVVITGLIAVLGGIIGVARKGQWTPADDRAGLWFIGAIDLQVLLGLSLYFLLSPITRAAI